MKTLHRILHHLLLPAALSAASTAAGQTLVSPYTPGVTTEGITYFLPETHVRFVLTATRRCHTPGEYAQYAERYLAVSDAPTAPYETWTLDNVEMIPYGVPDTSRVYTIALSSKTSAPLVSLTPDGILLAVNAETEQPDALPEAGRVTLPAERLDAADYLTADILRAATRAKRAELAAQEIYDIRENRSLLAKGLADFNPADGEQLKTMLQQLSTAEQALTTLFTGSERAERHTFVIDFRPRPTTEPRILFRFSKFLGLVDADDLAGEPYRISVTDETRLPELPADEKKKKKEKPDLRYCLPGRARITLSTASETVAETIMAVAQMGRVEHLGGELFNKKATTHVWLNPVTGNIEKIASEDEGVE